MQTLKTTTIVSAAFLSLLLSACGGGGSSPLDPRPNSSSSSSAGQLSSGAASSIDTISPADIGRGDGSTFVSGEIATSHTTAELAAGASTNLSVSIVSSTNTLITTPIEVTFNSRCLAAGEATLTSGATTTNKVSTDIGQAGITYTAKGCVGNDEVTATAVIGTTAKVARVTIVVAQDTVQSIRFVDATPDKIFLKDSGGAQTSVVRFLVLGNAGAPIKNIPLNFALSTQVGGIALTTASATTDSTGHASTVVQAGTIPTAVEVIATETTSGVTARSNKLSIGTGMPDQNSMSISASRFNPPGWDYNGETVSISVYLADADNNPPPDGTSVQFITEGGTIDPNCTTTNGTCVVTWKSTTPRPSNGRVTILATTVGNESFEDVDGDGVYTFGKDIFNTFNNGGNCNPNVPLSTAEATPGGNDEPCDDLGEAYLDANEDGEYNAGEKIVDFNINGRHDTENGIYNGVLCAVEGEGCTKSPVNIRQDIILSMSSERPMTQNGRLLGQPEFIEMGANETTSFNVTLADINGNAMPIGTTVSLNTSTASDVTINQSMSGAVPSTLNPTTFTVTLKASETKRPTGSFNIVITSPKGPAYSFSTRLVQKPLENTAARYIGKGLSQAFTAGKIDVGIGDAVLPPSGTTSLSVNLVDGDGNLTTGSAEVAFTSACIRAGTAKLTNGSGEEITNITTQTGRATVIYTAAGCMGTDEVTATSTLPSLIVSTATTTLTITEVSAQNIVFDSATPGQISLKGAGGQETSNVVFIINGPDGLPLAGVPVTLTLNNNVGGVCLASGGTCTQQVSAISAINGTVVARVQAGTITTTVRVTASTETSNGDTISTQSSGLVVSTGIPDQDSMSISASQYNPPVYTEGFEVDVTIRMADAFNNPVPEGTSVSFTTSGGSIQSSCTTNEASACTVKWRNQSPRPATGRVTILATALGNESFIDANSNGIYDAGDIFSTSGTSCNLNAPTPTLVDPTDSCDDLGEAYLDGNQNGLYDLGEVFVDVFGPNNTLIKDGLRTEGNGIYDGALCPATGATCTRNSVTVRQDLTLVLGRSEAASVGNRLIGQPANVVVAANQIETFTVILVDANGNSLPGGTEVTLITDNLEGASATLSPTEVIVPLNILGPTTFDVVVKGDSGTPASGQFQIEVITPNGAKKAYTTIVTAI